MIFLRRGECGASRRPPLGVCLFLSLFAVCRRFSLPPLCRPTVFLPSSFSLLSLLPLSRRSPLPRSAAPPPPVGPLLSRLLLPLGAVPLSSLRIVAPRVYQALLSRENDSSDRPPTPIICRHVKLLLRSTLSSITCTFIDGVGTGVPLGYVVTADDGITTDVSSSSSSSSPAASRSSLRSAWLTLHAVNIRPIHPIFFSRSSARALDLSLLRTHVLMAIEAAFPTTCRAVVLSSPLLRAPFSFFRVWNLLV